MNLRRDEMAFRIVYLELLRKKELTTVFRPGNRIYPSHRGYTVGEKITARVIEIPGDDGSLIAPKFLDEVFPIQITEIVICDISKLAEKDFEGSSPDVKNKEQLRYHLGLIYNKPVNYFREVSKISFKYLD